MSIDLIRKSKALALAGATTAALWATWPAPAGAEALCWEAEDGMIGCTDDPARVPERYEPWVQDTDLAGYARLTVPDSDAVRAVQAEQQRRLSELRCLNQGTLRRPVRPEYPRLLDELSCFLETR